MVASVAVAPGSKWARNTAEETIADRAAQASLDGKVYCSIHRAVPLDSEGGCEWCRRAAHPGVRPEEAAR